MASESTYAPAWVCTIIITRSENMLKYWAKSNFLLLHVSTSTQQKIIVPIRVWPAYSQTLPKYIYMLLAKTKARVDNTPKDMNKHSHRARTKHSPSPPAVL